MHGHEVSLSIYNPHALTIWLQSPRQTSSSSRISHHAPIVVPVVVPHVLLMVPQVRRRSAKNKQIIMVSGHEFIRFFYDNSYQSLNLCISMASKTKDKK